MNWRKTGKLPIKNTYFFFYNFFHLVYVYKRSNLFILLKGIRRRNSKNFLEKFIMSIKPTNK